MSASSDLRCTPQVRSGNKGSPQNIRWLLKTHYNYQLKINITAKRSYQSKIIKFFFGGQGLWVVDGWDTEGIFLFELKYVMVFRIQVFID